MGAIFSPAANVCCEPTTVCHEREKKKTRTVVRVCLLYCTLYSFHIEPFPNKDQLLTRFFSSAVAQVPVRFPSDLWTFRCATCSAGSATGCGPRRCRREVILCSRKRTANSSGWKSFALSWRLVSFFRRVVGVAVLVPVWSADSAV